MNLRAPAIRTELVILAGVLLAALGLRTWGGFFGLPHVFHPDEGFEVYRAVRLGMGGFDVEHTATGGYYFLLFVEYGVFFVWSMLTGAVAGAGEFVQAFVRDPSPFWKIGRVTTAVLGTFTVALVWWQGRSLVGARAGLLGAAFLAFSFQHVADSHFITVDVPMTLFAFWSVVLVVEDVFGRSRLRVLTFAPVAAFAMLCKLPAFVLFVPFLAAAWLRGGFRGRDGVLSSRTGRLIGATLAIWIVANPGVVLRFGELVGSAAVGVESETNPWAFYAQALLHSQGPALLALAGIGAALGLGRRDRGVALHLAFLVPYLVALASASTGHLYPRQVVPLLPGLCLLAGLALDGLVRRIQDAPRPAGLLATAVALMLVIEPGLAAANWNRRLLRTDTRAQAARWIEQNLEHRTRVLLEGFPEEAARLAVPLRNTKQNIRDMIEELRVRDPGQATYWEIKLEAQDKPMYDLVAVRSFEPWGDLEQYVGNGVEYVVLRREHFVPGERDAAKHDEEVASSRYRFYVDLVGYAGAERVAFFPASESGDPGYDIEVWRLSPAGEDPALAGADTTEASG